MNSKAISRRRFVELGIGTLGATSLVGLVGCNVEIKTDGDSASDSTPSEPNGVTLKGTYVVRPGQTETDAGVDFSAIPDTRSLVLCVYDLENTSEKNWGIYFPDIEISYPSGNTYEPGGTSSEVPSQVQTFVKRCGYASANDTIELDAGAAPKRYIAAFLVGESDLGGDEAGTLTIGLDDGLGGSFELASDSLKEIALPDSIFEIEENPDAYQLARSLTARSNIAYNLVSTAISSANSGDNETCTVNLTLAHSFLSEDTTWGVSCLMDGMLDTTTVLSDDLPSFNVEAIASVDEERGADAATLRDCTSQMVDAFSQGDYTTLNTVKNQAVTVFTKYLTI